MSEIQIISKFKEKPRLRKTWWAMGLGLATFLELPLLGALGIIIQPLIDGPGGSIIAGIFGVGSIIFILSFSISALVFSLKAYKKGERSWVLWVGFVPAILINLFWLIFLVGEVVSPH